MNYAFVRVPERMYADRFFYNCCFHKIYSKGKKKKSYFHRKNIYCIVHPSKFFNHKAKECKIYSTCQTKFISNRERYNACISINILKNQ